VVASSLISLSQRIRKGRAALKIKSAVYVARDILLVVICVLEFLQSEETFFLSLVLDLLFGSGGACPKYFLPGGLRKNHLLGSISKMQSCTLFSHMFFFLKEEICATWVWRL